MTKGIQTEPCGAHEALNPAPLDRKSYIVCGWFTPDYEDWVGPLRASLETFGMAHDFVRVEKDFGGWELNTLRKPAMIEEAMWRHPAQTVVFLDVDAVVLGPLDELAAINADVGMHFAVKTKSSGNNALFARSGTMVLKPTPMARNFVCAWRSFSDGAPLGWVDQSTLLEALWHTPGITIEQLDVRYCATRKDKVTEPVVVHDNASGVTRKMPPWLRTLAGFARARRRG